MATGNITMGSFSFFVAKQLFTADKTNPKKDPQKILVLKTGAIGDVLMTTPFLRALRKRFPKAHITYYVGNWSKEVLANNPNIDVVQGFDESIMLRKKIMSAYSLIKAIHQQHFDLCFVLDRSYLINVFAARCKIPSRIGFDREGEGFALTTTVPVTWGNHHIKEYLKLLEPFGVHDNHYSPEVFATQNDKKKVQTFFKQLPTQMKKRIGIAPLAAKNPGEIALHRRWPLQNYEQLIHKLLKKENTLIFLYGSSEEQEQLEALRNKFQQKNRIFVTHFNLLESIVSIQKMSLFITHDSGPMHMASCAGTKVLSLFGPTNPNEKAPLTPGSHFIWKNLHLKGIKKDYLTKDGMEKISVDEVYRQAMRMLP